MPRGRLSFFEVITAAVNDLIAHGYDSAERVAYWMGQIREAAERAAAPPHALEQALNDTMRAVYRKLVDQGDLLRLHPGVSRFTLERIKPDLRPVLDRYILGAANLVKLNREQAIEKTLRRFSGWATSVPAGGTKMADRVKVKAEVRKALAQLPFEERRVLIDQGHKLTASISATLAQQNNAIAAIWRHHYVKTPRPAHVKRDGTVFLVRDSWARQAGLVKPDAGYTDQIEQPAELPFCRCGYRWIYALRDLPAELLTAKGRAELQRTRIGA